MNMKLCSAPVSYILIEKILLFMLRQQALGEKGELG